MRFDGICLTDWSLDGETQRAVHHRHSVQGTQCLISLTPHCHSQYLLVCILVTIFLTMKSITSLHDLVEVSIGHT